MTSGIPHIDLASRWLGGGVVAASDESFGLKENLLVPTPADFTPGRYDHRGEIVDGWETRRRRGEPGHDWAIIRLGAPGLITHVDVDTSFFTGNYPPTCRLEACGLEGYPGPQELAAAGWTEIVPAGPLKGDSHNHFTVADSHRYTHVRLSIHPDGGIARLRVHGHVIPDPRHWDGLTIDLASQEHGGLVTESSDSFYTSAELLNRPDRARTMGEGWETSRRRDSGHDHAVITLAAAGRLRQIEIDTTHFKYNASAEIELHGRAADASWLPLLPRTALQPDTRHLFTLPAPGDLVSAVRIDAYPDGGISRARLIGSVDPAARRHAGLRWFNTLPDDQAAACLTAAGLTPGDASAVLAARPLIDVPAGPATAILTPWIDGRP
ncbi:putative allantoicase [Planotetraspora thailandica]|uniref:Probable allantoicase n=1 Tax=Planotetraspora thailandica TaxID=487172 RepID=A0A8J3XZZ1_9ACTN|nr:allantoicase [Planotetraspora thailandica]GII58298.1 putative allantoicase [Planotetraspora thailandica]